MRSWRRSLAVDALAASSGVLISAAVSTAGTSQVEGATSGGVAHAQTHRTHPQRTFGGAVTGGATGVADAVVRGYRHAEGADEKKSDIGSVQGRLDVIRGVGTGGSLKEDQRTGSTTHSYPGTALHIDRVPRWARLHHRRRRRR
eukprot:ctg_4475.g424